MTGCELEYMFGKVAERFVAYLEANENHESKNVVTFVYDKEKQTCVFMVSTGDVVFYDDDVQFTSFNISEMFEVDYSEQGHWEKDSKGNLFWKASKNPNGKFLIVCSDWLAHQLIERFDLFEMVYGVDIDEAFSYYL